MALQTSSKKQAQSSVRPTGKLPKYDSGVAWTGEEVRKIAAFIQQERGYIVIGFTEAVPIGSVVSHVWDVQTYRPWIITAVSDRLDWQRQLDLVAIETGAPISKNDRRGGIFMRAVQGIVVAPCSANGEKPAASSKPEKSGNA